MTYSLKKIMKNTEYPKVQFLITSHYISPPLGHLDSSLWRSHSAKGSKSQYTFHLTLSQIKPSIMNVKIKYMGKDKKPQNINENISCYSKNISKAFIIITTITIKKSS